MKKMMIWKLKQPSLKSSVEKPEMPTDGSWAWRPISPSMRTNILTQQELWFSSTECPRNEEKPLLKLGSPSLKTNTSLMQTRPEPRLRKPSRPHSPPMTQQCKLELPLLHSTKTRRTPQDLTNTSPPFLSVHSRITDYHALSEWFLQGLDLQIVVQLTLSGAVKASTTMEELYSKASEIEGGYCCIASLRRGPQPSYGEGSCYHNPYAMDMDHLMLSPVEWVHHMHEKHCFICHKEGCSARNHPGYSWNRPTGSWCNNSKPSQTAHTRVISTTPHSTPTPCQDNPLDTFLKDVTKTQGCD